MFKQISNGISSYLAAHRFISKHRMWGYLLLPGLLNLILVGLTIWFAIAVGDTLSDLIMSTMPDFEDGFWKGTLSFFIALIVRIILFFIYALIYKNIVLILMSPVMALLSEKVEKLATGKEYPFQMKQFLRDVWRGVRIAFKNLIIEITIIVCLSLMTFIPILGWVAPLFIFVIQSYFYGFSMMDYTNERKKWTMRESSAYIYKNKWLAMTNGALFYFILIIPFVGWIFAPCYGVIAATLAMLKLEDKIND